VRQLAIAMALLCVGPSCADDEAHDNFVANDETRGSAGARSMVQNPIPATGDTWESFAEGFFVRYFRLLPQRDNAGVAARDFHVRPCVEAESAEIACGVSKSTQDWRALGCSGLPPARQFPVGNGPEPSDAERDRLVAWINVGRP
jgi:hypothetical protein